MTAPERELGQQPIAAIMAKQGIKPHDMVAASTEQLTHKMVSRACKGRILTPRVKVKVLNSLNCLTGQSYSLQDLFNY